MRNFAKILVFILIFGALAAPVLSLAVEPPGLVPCGKTDDAGNISKMCDFNDFMKLVNNVIKFVLFKLALPIAAIMFAYAGFLMVTAGGSTERATKAKRIFTNVAVGFIIAVIAWLVVRLILMILGFKGDWIGF